MKQLDIQQLNKLIQEEKWGHIKQLFKEFLEQELTTKEEGELYAELGAAMMEVETRRLEKYNEDLQKSLDVLRSINTAEKESVSLQR